MSVRVVRSEPCLDDTIAIWEYLDDRSPVAARRVIERINNRIDSLESFPYAGECQPQHGLACRRLIEGNYLIFYDVYDDRVEVLRVLHAARRIERLGD